VDRYKHYFHPFVFCEGVCIHQCVLPRALGDGDIRIDGMEETG
jgi:hypothetical protein